MPFHLNGWGLKTSFRGGEKIILRLWLTVEGISQIQHEICTELKIGNLACDKKPKEYFFEGGWEENKSKLWSPELE